MDGSGSFDFKVRRGGSQSLLSNSLGSQPISFTVFLQEAEFEVNVAKFGSMRSIARLRYSDIFKTTTQTLSGQNPRWQETFTFEVADDDRIEFVCYHAAMLIGEIEIGRGWLKCSGQDSSDCVKLTTPRGTPAGWVKVGLSYDYAKLQTDPSVLALSSNHSASNSMDMREEYMRRLNDLELEREEVKFLKQKYKLRREQMKDPRKEVCYSEPAKDEIEDLRSELSEEHRRIEQQEQKVKKVFAKLKEDEGKLRQVRVDLRDFKANIKSRENALLERRQQLEDERSKLGEERVVLEQYREQMNKEYSQLKQDKLKVKTKAKLIQTKGVQIGKTTKMMDGHKAKVDRMLSERSLRRPRAGNRDIFKEESQLEMIAQEIGIKASFGILDRPDIEVGDSFLGSEEESEEILSVRSDISAAELTEPLEEDRRPFATRLMLSPQ
jgi:DNA repair exonuclease SbcCD ATPase subunit